jgi:hypothetical protein
MPFCHETTTTFLSLRQPVSLTSYLQHFGSRRHLLAEPKFLAIELVLNDPGLLAGEGRAGTTNIDPTISWGVTISFLL